MKLKKEDRVKIDVAEDRALAYLNKQHRLELFPANCVAIEIWPNHEMTSQGAGAAASRILKRLSDRGLARWDSNGRNWGWKITNLGRILANKGR